MLGMVEKGHDMIKAFVGNGLSTAGGKLFHGTLSQSKVVTFTDMKKQTKVSLGKGITKLIHISTELVFRRALCLSNHRDDVSMDAIMCYPIGPVPSSLFDEYGQMRKSTKSHLMAKLEDEVTGLMLNAPNEHVGMPTSISQTECGLYQGCYVLDPSIKDKHW